MLIKTFALSGLAAVASAHITMTNPVPFGKSSLNNSPLAGDGSDFPCKQRPDVYDAQGASNVYKQGSTQQLSFQGTAVHGGGSCQVSVTKDMKPTKDSVWKVIKSIEGGCPAKGQAGNMGDSASSPVPFKYDFDIPKELAAGNYTLAWTWFNKIGNREMYMNCAPMTVQGSGGSDSFVESLPDMFVANIGNQCTVPDSTDALFPNPGKDVDQFNGATKAFAMPTDPGCQKPTAGSGGGDSGSSPTTGGSSGPTTAPVSNPAPTSAPADSNPPASSVPGGVFVTAPASQPAGSEPAATQPTATATGAPSAPATPDTPVPTSAPAPSSESPDAGSGGSTSSGGSSGGGNPAGTACSSEGEWNCIGGNSFQRCASGMWSPVQNMAAGVKCTAGQSANLEMSAMKAKRAMRRAFRAVV